MFSRHRQSLYDFLLTSIATVCLSCTVFDILQLFTEYGMDYVTANDFEQSFQSNMIVELVDHA